MFFSCFRVISVLPVFYLPCFISSVPCFLTSKHLTHIMKALRTPHHLGKDLPRHRFISRCFQRKEVKLQKPNSCTSWFVCLHIYIYIPGFCSVFFNNPRMLQDFVYQPVWPCNQHVSGARFLVRNVSKIRNHCLHSGQLCRVASSCGIKNGIQNVLANFNGHAPQLFPSDSEYSSW